MKITTTKKFLKRIIIILALLLSYFLFIDTPKAQIIIPALPSGFDEENWPYIISYQETYQTLTLTYCKNANDFLSADTTWYSGTPITINTCWEEGTWYNGYAYRRTINDVVLTQEEVNSYSFQVNGTWGEERQAYYYTTSLNMNLETNKIVTWKDYLTESIYNTAVITGNTNLYNYNSSDILLSVSDYQPSQSISIDYEIINGNGYADVYFYANNYTPSTIEDYDVKIRNLNNGNYTKETIQPNESGFSELKIRVYNPTNFYYYVEDKNTNEIINEEIISVSMLNYSNFNVDITNIDKENQSITYHYRNWGNLTDYTCTHQVSGGQEIEDLNCNVENNSYTLNIGGNKSVVFKIYQNENVIFKTTTPFVFTGNTPYITYQEELNGNIVNLKVILNSYNDSNYVVKYQLNDGTEMTPTLTQEPSAYNDRYSFIVWNIVEDTDVNVNIYDTNNNLITSSYYQYNIVKIQEVYGEDFGGVNGFLNTINLENISNELKEIIQNIGNLIMSSKLGGILITMATITALGFVFSLMRR